VFHGSGGRAGALSIILTVIDIELASTLADAYKLISLLLVCVCSAKIKKDDYSENPNKRKLYIIPWLLVKQHVTSLIRYTYFVHCIHCTRTGFTMSVRGDVNNDEGGVPEYGWKVDFDHQFPDPRTPTYMPRIKQILQLLPLIVR